MVDDLIEATQAWQTFLVGETALDPVGELPHQAWVSPPRQDYGA